MDEQGIKKLIKSLKWQLVKRVPTGQLYSMTQPWTHTHTRQIPVFLLRQCQMPYSYGHKVTRSCKIRYHVTMSYRVYSRLSFYVTIFYTWLTRNPDLQGFSSASNHFLEACLSRFDMHILKNTLPLLFNRRKYKLYSRKKKKKVCIPGFKHFFFHNRSRKQNILRDFPSVNQWLNKTVQLFLVKWYIGMRFCSWTTISWLLLLSVINLWRDSSVQSRKQFTIAVNCPSLTLSSQHTTRPRHLQYQKLNLCFLLLFHFLFGVIAILHITQCAGILYFRSRQFFFFNSLSRFTQQIKFYMFIYVGMFVSV